MSFHNNISTCMRGCPHADETAQVAMCMRNGKSTVENANAGICPMGFFNSPSTIHEAPSTTAPCGCQKRRDAMNEVVPGLGTAVEKLFQVTGIAAVVKSICK